MKYILSFDINKVKELNRNGIREYEANSKSPRKILDSDDLLILKYLINLNSSDNVVRENDYFWFKLNSLLEEFDGLILISKSALQKRLKKYQDMGLISRYCKKNSDGSFAFVKLEKVLDLIYVAPKETNIETDDNQVESIENVLNSDDNQVECEVDEEKKMDYDLRVEQVERILKTKASKKLKSQLARFENHEDFFKYFDKFIYPMIENGEQHTCKYLINNLKYYFQD